MFTRVNELNTRRPINWEWITDALQGLFPETTNKSGLRGLYVLKHLWFLALSVHNIEDRTV